MTHAHRLGECKIASDIDLSGWLPRCDPAGDGAAEIVFQLGRVCSQLPAPDHVTAVFQTRSRSQCLLALPGIGRILVEHGQRVTFEPESPRHTGAGLDAAGALLTGPVQGVLWHQRGVLPLRASGVVIDGRAWVLAGPTAAGKSTLAAMLAAKGHAVLADDICVLQIGDTGIRVLPGSARLRLWRDALDRLGLPSDAATRIARDRERYLVDLQQDGTLGPHRLAAVVILTPQASGASAFERLRGHRAVSALDGVVHARRPAHALGQRADIFAALTRLAAPPTAIWRLTMTDDPACLDAALTGVLALADG